LIKLEVLQGCLAVAGLARISRDLIDGAISQWSERLMVVIQVQGGHMEHRLKKVKTNEH